MYSKSFYRVKLFLKRCLQLMYTTIFFSERKHYFALSLPDSSLSGLTIHNPWLEKNGLLAGRETVKRSDPFLSSRRKKVGRLRAGQPEAMERQRDVWKKAVEITKSVEDEERECKREVMPKSHQQLFYFWTLWSSVERDLPPHWSDLFTAPCVCLCDRERVY